VRFSQTVSLSVHSQTADSQWRYRLLLVVIRAIANGDINYGFGSRGFEKSFDVQDAA
jgi:hypothetical protein